jgi:hypothetical protein
MHETTRQSDVVGGVRVCVWLGNIGSRSDAREKQTRQQEREEAKKTKEGKKKEKKGREVQKEEEHNRRCEATKRRKS